MKSKFAKFIDGTLGAFLVFFAAVALLRYFTPMTEVAVLCAFSVTACVCLIAKVTGKKKSDSLHLSAAADDMFFEFMFMSESAIVALLHNGLKNKGLPATRHGNGIYVNDTAAYCNLSNTDSNNIARLIAKAEHYGAKKIVVLSRQPLTVPQVDGVEVTVVCGENVYKLFGSLGSLPKLKHKSQNKKRSAFKNAFSKDKILRYILLALSFFFMSRLSSSVITFVCSIVCATLAVISVTLTAIKARKKKQSQP